MVDPGSVASGEDTSAVAARLAALRATYERVLPADLADELDAGALVVDTRPAGQRERDGELPGAVVVCRNVLEWRLDPTSDHRLAEAHADRRIILVCNQGYSSTLAVSSLHALGLHRATDLVDGFQGLLVAGVLSRLRERAAAAG